MCRPHCSTLFPYTTLFRSVGRAEFLWAFALLMAVVAVVLVRMGFEGFSREALLARDAGLRNPLGRAIAAVRASFARSEEHTSELQSRRDLVCRLLLEKKKS